VIAFAVTGRVARRLRTESWIAFLLVMSVGAVLAATIPPDAGGFSGRPSAPGRCDFGRIGLAPLSQYLHLGDTSLNVILFVPLGLAIGLLGRSPATARVLVAVLALPLAIEAIQSLLPMLGRGCQSRDVVDNLLGLGIGLALGVLLSVVRAGRTRSCSARGAPAGPDSRGRRQAFGDLLRRDRHRDGDVQEHHALPRSTRISGTPDAGRNWSGLGRSSGSRWQARTA
jgi:VanZ family protein